MFSCQKIDPIHVRVCKVSKSSDKLRVNSHSSLAHLNLTKDVKMTNASLELGD